MFENQPKALYALALANTGERFGYYTMIAVFSLFLRANFGLSGDTAGLIYGVFLALVYFFPLVGGIMMLRHLQRCGHKPYLLVGGATGMIGDPSGKSQERNLLDAETLYHNQEAIKRQVSKFLDFDGNEPNKAEMVNNYDWMKNFTFLDFARLVGKHITVNYMMAKDSVKKRLSGEARDGLSFTEFTYQLLQGYDFLYLYEKFSVKLQLGGNDQWGNMTTGTELIRRTLGNETEAFCLTCPLITKADGKKFGKTESGNIWLDRNRTTPYAFYQFWLNVSDDDAEKYIKIFTSLEQDKSLPKL